MFCTGPITLMKESAEQAQHWDELFQMYQTLKKALVITGDSNTGIIFPPGFLCMTPGHSTPAGHHLQPPQPKGGRQWVLPSYGPHMAQLLPKACSWHSSLGPHLGAPPVLFQLAPYLFFPTAMTYLGYTPKFPLNPQGPLTVFWVSPWNFEWGATHGLHEYLFAYLTSSFGAMNNEVGKPWGLGLRKHRQLLDMCDGPVSDFSTITS